MNIERWIEINIQKQQSTKKIMMCFYMKVGSPSTHTFCAVFNGVWDHWCWHLSSDKLKSASSGKMSITRSNCSYASKLQRKHRTDFCMDEGEVLMRVSFHFQLKRCLLEVRLKVFNKPKCSRPRDENLQLKWTSDNDQPQQQGGDCSLFYFPRVILKTHFVFFYFWWEV